MFTGGLKRAPGRNYNTCEGTFPRSEITTDHSCLDEDVLSDPPTQRA
jgi:hypothetical protein